MTATKKIFYNLFWKNKSCQNLFLLSKEELLETYSYDFEGVKGSHSLPRIIISNAQNNEDDILDTVINRTETQNITLDVSINERLNHFLPIFESLFEKKLKNPIENVIKHIEEKGFFGVIRILLLVTNEEKREENIIKLLKEFKFIGPHINSFEQLENNFKRVLLPKNGGEVLNEKNINTFFEGIKLVKDIYVNHSYKKLYSTNQILINSLNSEDDFTSRIKLFHLLFENNIILASKEDALIECTNCKPGTYKGVFQLNIDPNKLNKLKCPVCNSELTYFVPYELHKEIYDIVKSHDGLLLDAYCNVLESKKYKYKTNQHFLDNIEIDCIFCDGSFTYIVEAKMYKLNTDTDKLKSKIRGHFGKLINDVTRLQKLQEFNGIVLKPILLVNVIDTNLVQEIEVELKEKNTELIAHNTRILNLNLIMK